MQGKYQMPLKVMNEKVDLFKVAISARVLSNQNNLESEKDDKSL
jgi:hypothetical protein